MDALLQTLTLRDPPTDPGLRRAFGFEQCTTPAEERALLSLYRSALGARRMPPAVLRYASLSGRIDEILAVFLEEHPLPPRVIPASHSFLAQLRCPCPTCSSRRTSSPM